MFFFFVCCYCNSCRSFELASVWKCRAERYTQHSIARYGTTQMNKLYTFYILFLYTTIFSSLCGNFLLFFFFHIFFSSNLVFSRSVSLSLFMSRSFVFCVLACAKAITICMLLPKCARHEHAFGYRNAQRDRENAEHQTYTIENAEIVSATPNAKTFYTHATREKNNK